ncbi:hypothetical protein OsJ_20018 [Oryza sativa Japonica Group]|uniref:Protein EXORDIUM-like 3 n=1 Tax=Oryza sativa subsp. japonica TaxID=39947 RepID=B9FRC5_ORYSJ|nr:hypothetical protein OsJ_20018 [Oryza sativa Japonica Group]
MAMAMHRFSLCCVVLLVLAPLAAVAWRPWPPRNGSGEVEGIGASKKFEGSSDFVKLQYHMGPVLAADITVHPIWYGRWPAEQKRTIRAFLRSLSPPGSGLRRWRHPVAVRGGVVAHRAAVHRPDLGERVRGGEARAGESVVRDAVTARTRPLPVDSSGVYLVLTSPEVVVENFCGQVCGFHYFTFPSVVGYTLPYAWVGNSAARCPEVCAYPFAIPSYVGGGRRAEAPPNGDVGVDGMVSVIAHELAELASNPLANAWYAGEDPSFPTEIADLCEGIYGTGGGGAYTGQLLTDGRSGASYNVNGVGGRKFLVQWVWNPILSYCSGPNALDQ